MFTVVRLVMVQTVDGEAVNVTVSVELAVAPTVKDDAP
jgi:hypothetical protein